MPTPIYQALGPSCYRGLGSELVALIVWEEARIVPTQLPLADGRAIHIRKPSQPVNEQKRVCQMLGIDWESAFSSKKTETQA